LRLYKCLYRLKQLSYEWYSKADEFLTSIGFTKSKADLNLYIRGSIYLLLYIDNNIIISTRADVDWVKQQLKSRWKYKDLGTATQFIGL
jgi:hypothetical protein